MDFKKEFDELKKDITPMKTAKFIGGTLISLGATAAVIGIMNSPLQGSKGITKMLMKVGILALACKAGDMAEQYFSDQVDEIKKNYDEAKAEVASSVVS